MDKLYSVEDLAQACHVTPRAVRLYVDKGLLAPMRAGRAYVFTSISVERLNIIIRCKRLGLTLSDIKARLNPSSQDDLQNMIARMEDITLDATTELQDLTEQLSDMRRQERS
ncbi:MAG: MerR family transcriptional regulator [Magnetovibrio sp.]|nr:MerR family transcriptional regulator [Magnetovibrio sp.]